MAYDTYSLFDAIEADQSMQRQASRSALNLASTRVANKMGAFLRGARDEEEFFARLGLLGDDLDELVYTASAEVGYDDYKSISATIKEHYRGLLKSADSVEFDISPVEHEEDEEEEAGPTPLGKKADLNPLDPMVADGLTSPAETGPALGQMVSPFSSPSPQPLAANPATQVNQNAPASGMPQLPGSDPNSLKNAVINQAQGISNPTQLNSSWNVVADDHWIDKAIKQPGALGKWKPLQFFANQWIQERNGKYVIVQKGTNKVLSMYASRVEAEASFSAMEWSKHKGAQIITLTG